MSELIESQQHHRIYQKKDGGLEGEAITKIKLQNVLDVLIKQNEI